MFTKIHWKEEYLSGIEIIDKQHKDIINALNLLYDYLDTAETNEALTGDFLQQLDLYTTIHFDTEEEEIMRDYDYPGYLEHKNGHEFFKSAYNEIKNNKFYSKNSNIFIFSLHLTSILGDWLDVHLTTTDKALFDFLKPIYPIGYKFHFFLNSIAKNESFKNAGRFSRYSLAWLKSKSSGLPVFCLSFSSLSCNSFDAELVQILFV